ncbi:hypothetical protein K491DRAFT_213293 [Lophiostoma macrostomum CBS 122681]|uniref:Uncharacterized protein n=1 Tax=Lophiostoma macrostomum CBS 122681 TaxID=1314788 RepID=A0A6A6SMW3_9PLEO|nr:hypothetical protein K491DRAFT_213293 [Lophiostoma macrostomum CBS 122681]
MPGGYVLRSFEWLTVTGRSNWEVLRPDTFAARTTLLQDHDLLMNTRSRISLLLVLIFLVFFAFGHKQHADLESVSARSTGWMVYIGASQNRVRLPGSGRGVVGWHLQSF